MKAGREIKVVRRGQGQVLNAVEITAENMHLFTDAVANPYIGMWVVSDLKHYAVFCGSKESTEQMFEPAPKRYSTRPGWLDREPEEMQKR